MCSCMYVCVYALYGDTFQCLGSSKVAAEARIAELEGTVKELRDALESCQRESERKCTALQHKYADLQVCLCVCMHVHMCMHVYDMYVLGRMVKGYLLELELILSFYS